MKTHGNDRDLCRQAEEHYYEILCRDGVGIPEAVTHHIASCPSCQEQIRRLRDTLAQTVEGADSPGSPSDGTPLDVLSRQFEFLDETVTCSHAKPFLPSLLPSSSAIRIPTPISVHVENCPECTKDMAAIEEMELSEDQLRRLGEFYAQPPLDPPSHEERATAAAMALAAFSFAGATPDALDHACRCPTCRSLVCHQRKRAAADLGGGQGRRRVLLCDEISTAELFDYVLPFGLTAADVNRADGRRDAVATHLRTCRPCLERVQSLHRTIHGIAERADSHVRTLYRCQTDEELARNASQASPHRYPVHVQIHRPEPTDSGLRRKPRVRLRKRPLLQGTTLAAAVVLVGSLFLLRSSTATGKNVGDLHRALRQQPNVRIAYLNSGDLQPNCEMWVSRDLNRIVRKTGEEWVEYNLDNRWMIGVGKGLEPGVPFPLSRKHAAQCAKYLEEPLGDIFSSVRPGDDLVQVDSVASDRPGASLAVYELTRESRTANGNRMWNRWRAFIDSALDLPVRIESWSRQSENLPWELDTTVCLSYPATAEVKSELKALLPLE